MNNVKDARSFARAKVYHLDARLAGHPLQGGNMASSQVDDMDVVAHARAVGRRVVVSEDAHGSELTDRNLSNIRNEIVRDTLGVLAN